MTRSIPRLEDAPLLLGKGCFVGDLRLTGMLSLEVIRSQYACGELRSVELEAARSAPGVLDVFAFGDLSSPLPPIPCRLPLPHGLEPLLQPPLADSRVRYVGQPLAVVVAETPVAARDAADLVRVEIEPEPLPPPELVHADELAVGDAADALRQAAVVVRSRFRIGRQGSLPIEPRGLVAEYDGERHLLTIWNASKVPHHHRAVVASALRLPEERVRYRPVDAGGGFGVRGELHPEDLLVALAAFRNGRPVRWLETRLEHMQAAYQSRDQEWAATIGLSAEGAIVALDATVRCDLGAFVGPNGLTPGRIAQRSLPGPYRVPAYRCRTEYVVTPKTPLGTMRAPGNVESSFVRERLLDLAAKRLGMAPAELRRQNLVMPGEMPYDTGIEGVVLDGGDYAAALDRALAEVGPGNGIGMACVVEGTGTPGVERARARLEPSGRITVTAGSASLGQGHPTTLAQIAAGALGVAPEIVDVVEGDTAALESGGGTFASRTAVTIGSAVRRAAEALRDARTKHPDVAPLEAEGEFESTCQTFTYGAGAARVEIDRETGSIRLLELAVVADAGVAINPEIVRGQLLGGAAHGVGGALFESLVHDESGQPLTGGLRDYHLPLAGDLPAIKAVVLETAPSPANPLGARGVGEIAVGAAAAAIANAVAAASVRAEELPILPEAVADWGSTS